MNESPVHASAAAAAHLSPAFPRRAAWGTASALRAWQEEALSAYLARQPDDFLTVATPGAGKTTFALRVATELLNAGTVRAITVVAPTEHLKTQWADAAARVGIQLDPTFSNTVGDTSSAFDGVAVTYAQVAANPGVHQRRTGNAPTLVILDEIHHGGDGLTWGDAIAVAFQHAQRRLSLTGTPFRSDTNPIPFVTYAPDSDGIRRSLGDYTYGYAEALKDGVVRPVMFMAYSGQMRWKTRAGEELSARLSDPMTKDQIGHAWRTALDPKGQWIPAVLKAADKRLSEIRRGVPDAGGLIIATDQQAARAYARVLRELTGQVPAVVLSDDAGSSDRIEQFAGDTDQRWMVAVRMVSEGVDIPRLCVGVYATSASTPLYFAQAVGRFVRARRRGETASIFLPSVPSLLELAHELEAQRDHALDRSRRDSEAPSWSPEEGLVAAANRNGSTPDEPLGAFEAIDSDASFDHVLFDGGQFGLQTEAGSVEEEDFLGIPGLLEPDQVRTLLKQRQSQQQAKRNLESTEQLAATSTPGMHRKRDELRKELQSLVGSWSRRSGEPHAVVHTELRRRCGGPEVATADVNQLQQRVDLLRQWFVGKRP